MMTALQPSGMGRPVLIQKASLPISRRSGLREEAVKVSSALTATPSMAAPWNAGDERRASTGRESTRCSAAESGTSSSESSL